MYRSFYQGVICKISRNHATASVAISSHSQVTQETQALLSRHGYKCDYRGVVSVKGKGSLITYFVQHVAPNNNKMNNTSLLAW